MLILGINAFHADSSAAIVRDGRLVAAVEEERFRRVKHWAGFPSEAIAYCLREAGATVRDLDHVAVNQDGRAQFWHKVAYAAFRRPSPSLVLSRLRTRRARKGIPEHLAEAFPGGGFRGVVHAVEHHEAHLSSAFHMSPFAEAATVSVDGFGDFSSAAWGIGSGARLDVEGRVLFPHSLGVFYQALTQYLGFPHYGDEYKVMGLAPYGEPRFASQLRRLVSLRDDGGFALDLRHFRHHREALSFDWAGGVPEFATLYTPALVELLGPARTGDAPLEQRHRDIARSVQAVYEEAFFHLLRTMHDRHPVDAVTIAGGCGANSVANGKVRRETKYRRVYVQAAAGDAGGAIGAAYTVWHRHLGQGARFAMDHAYWGPSFDAAAIDAVLAKNAAAIAEGGCEVTRPGTDGIVAATAAAIADGLVVGWFQGRMEWGPRALGNRSIVCDPRRADMKAILNAKIKRRESFRPFAPSVLKEAVGEWFEEDDDVPFMMQVFQIREDRRAQIPAVTHVDGSGRLQTVHAETNPLYHRLISAFRDLTGVPMVLNTSFNENEPVVCAPDEALACFLRTKMDVLVLGDVLITRRPQAAAAG
ncbi:MAG: carbamoyltransferase [Bauldia sp.]|nr:carbamoyltransferase [Bauldia sp.]